MITHVCAECTCILAMFERRVAVLNAFTVDFRARRTCFHVPRVHGRAMGLCGCICGYGGDGVCCPACTDVEDDVPHKCTQFKPQLQPICSFCTFLHFFALLCTFLEVHRRVHARTWARMHVYGGAL